MSAATGFGVRAEQGPPLAVPASFFAIAPCAMVAAGALLGTHPAALTSRWLGETIALTHIGTLGLLGAVMLGALYQMLPVVAGSPMPAPRLAHLVWLAYTTGLVALVYGFLTDVPRAFVVAMVLLGLALAVFIAQAGLALVRAPTRSSTVDGMRIAIVALGFTLVLGVILASARAGGVLPGDLLRLSGAHMALGATCWVGGLLVSVSWQVVPMFYLTEPYPTSVQRATVGALLFSTLALPAALLLGLGVSSLVLVSGPAAIAVWAVHPVVTVRLLRRRERQRIDWTVRFWLAGMGAATVVISVIAIVLLPSDYPHAAVLVGWTAIWGWAGMVLHGMLTRIVPFLVWFHRYSKLLGTRPVPSMRKLLPATQIRAGLALHLGTLVCGWGAVVAESPNLARVTALGLVMTGVSLATALGRVLVPRWNPEH